MNIKKSIELAIAEKGYRSSYVAEQMNMTRQAFSQMKARKYHRMQTIEDLANIFDMPVSEFIKLGEDK